MRASNPPPARLAGAVLVDREGRIVMHHVGEGGEAAMEAGIRAALQ
jgi:hypothetical protein